MVRSELVHLLVTVFMWGFGGLIVIPAITDVTMAALCPGSDECSLAIYLTGFQQAVIGVGAVIMTPLIGNLSDKYGRKALLTLPMAASVIPLAIMAYDRETNFFYAYFVVRSVTAMIGDSAITCLALAYVADMVPMTERASAFGVFSGVISAAFVGATLAARFISSIALTFQVAAGISMIAVVYMRIFLPESSPQQLVGSCTEPMLQKEIMINKDENKKVHIFKTTSLGDTISLLRTSLTFSQAASVAFFNSLVDGALQASLLYFLKARFHYNKTQFADLMLIFGVSGTLSQLLFMPRLAPLLGEERLLSIALLAGCTNLLLNSIAWAIWVPYAATVFSVFGVLATPCIRTIASKQVGPFEQGKAQGCISGITSFGTIVSPLIFSPLTALFLSEGAPFHFPGFSILCVAFVLMIGFIQSLMIRAVPPPTKEIPEVGVEP